MKIIFLDIDGVLNGYNYWYYLGWKIVCFINNKSLKKLYRKITDPYGIHESKIKRLAKIVKRTNAKVVMSSSWRAIWFGVPYDKLTGDKKKLSDLLNKYNIKIIDQTPKSPDGRRDKEILAWLSKHEEEVENFIILDDENSFLRAFDDDKRFIQTSSVAKGVMIQGFPRENTGLKNKHVKQAIKILNNIKGR